MVVDFIMGRECWPHDQSAERVWSAELVVGSDYENLVHDVFFFVNYTYTIQ